MNYPKVLPDDDGIRPAGKPDECLYCKRKVGKNHKRTCVILSKKVKVKYIFELEIEMPWSWTKNEILFQRNESSWCADNALEELQNLSSELGCLCSVFKTEIVSMSNDPPYRRNKNDEIVP